MARIIDLTNHIPIPSENIFASVFNSNTKSRPDAKRLTIKNVMKVTGKLLFLRKTKLLCR